LDQRGGKVSPKNTPFGVWTNSEIQYRVLRFFFFLWFGFEKKTKEKKQLKKKKKKKKKKKQNGWSGACRERVAPERFAGRCWWCWGFGGWKKEIMTFAWPGESALAWETFFQ